MGAKTWMIAYSDGNAGDALKARPQLDRVATRELAEKLFPSQRLQPAEDGCLVFTCPRNNQVYVGCFPLLSIVAASDFALDKPSELPVRYLDAANGRTVYLHAMHSVVDWFAFAVWKEGELVRSLSLSPDSGVIENIGPRMSFEDAYWAGAYPVETDGEPYPLPFHPLDLGEAALLELFGYQLEGADSPIDPTEIPMSGFNRRKQWWKLW
jgi:hypothetical protein